MSFLGVFQALISDAPTLSSGRCCEQNSKSVGAILVDFGGDPFVDIICEQMIVVDQLSFQSMISKEAEYS